MRLTGSGVYVRPSPPPKMPPGLVEIMEDLTKNVLKYNPTNVYEFCAGHMHKLLEIRDGPKRHLSLEQKILRAQQKVRQRAEHQRQKIDKDMKLELYNMQNGLGKRVAKEQKSLLALQEGIEASRKSPIHHEQDLKDALEVEIFHKTHTAPSPLTMPSNVTESYQTVDDTKTDDYVEIDKEELPSQITNETVTLNEQNKKEEISCNSVPETKNNLQQSQSSSFDNNLITSTNANEDASSPIRKSRSINLNSEIVENTAAVLEDVDLVQDIIKRKTLVCEEIENNIELNITEEKKGDCHSFNDEKLQQTTDQSHENVVNEKHDNHSDIVEEKSNSTDTYLENTNEIKKSVMELVDDVTNGSQDNIDVIVGVTTEVVEDVSIKEIDKVIENSANVVKDHINILHSAEDNYPIISDNTEEINREDSEIISTLEGVITVDVTGENNDENPFLQDTQNLDFFKQTNNMDVIIEQEQIPIITTEKNDDVKRVEIGKIPCVYSEKNLESAVDADGLQESNFKNDIEDNLMQPINDTNILNTLLNTPEENDNLNDNKNIDNISTTTEESNANHIFLDEQVDSSNNGMTVEVVHNLVINDNGEKEKISEIVEKDGEINTEHSRYLSDNAKEVINESREEVYDTLTKDIDNINDVRYATHSVDGTNNKLEVSNENYQETEIQKTETGIKESKASGSILSLSIPNDVGDNTLNNVKEIVESQCTEGSDNVTIHEFETIQNNVVADEEKSSKSKENISSTPNDVSNTTEHIAKTMSFDIVNINNESTTEENNIIETFENDVIKTKEDSTHKNITSSSMDLETAAITIQKVFRTFLFKSRGSTFDDTSNDDTNLTEDDNEKVVNFSIPTNSNKERRTLGISRMDTVLQTVNEEKSLSLSTDDSSTLSSAATTIQAHVRGFLVRNKLNSNKTASTTSLVNSDGPLTLSLEADNNEPCKNNKTVLNIHIVPEGEGHFLSRDESMLTSIDLSLDASPPSSTNLHPLGYDKREPRKQLKREDAIQSVSPPSNNSGKLSEDVDSVTEIHNDSLEQQNVDGVSLSMEPHQDTNVVSRDTTPTESVTLETVIETHNISGLEQEKNNTEPERRKGTLTKMSSDESDVVTPFVPSDEKVLSTESDNSSKILHSGEFHDVVLPTKITRSDTSVVRGE